MVIDTFTADKAGLDVGDRVTVLTLGPRIAATVAGIAEFGSGQVGGVSVTAFSPQRAGELLDADGFTSIVVAADDRVTLPELRERIDAVLPQGYQAKTRSEQVAAESADVEEGLSFINVFLLVFAGVAVFVGSFIILNTFTMLVAQRTRELALFRALGASRRQVTASVLVEALVVGLLGSTLGLLAGLGVAAGLRELFAAIGLQLGGTGW